MYKHVHSVDKIKQKIYIYAVQFMHKRHLLIVISLLGKTE